MFRSLADATAAALGLVVMTASALAQSTTAGVALDLALPTQALRFATQDLKFPVEDMGGRVAGLEVKETATETRIALAADVLFDFDKAEILPKAQAALRQVAVFIKERGGGRPVRTEGHTDGKGSDAYNQRLSERRAQSVMSWLAQKEGLTGVAFRSQGFGARRPVAPNTKRDGSDDPEGRQKNRRVEIVLAK
jgi:outer membrane protein OmpA-like peptidoglycan-associated protein